MTHVLTLIGALAKTPLTETLVDQARRVLKSVAASAGDANWLAEGEACDIAFEGDAANVLSAVRRALDGLAIDIAVLPATGRRKKLLIADMDSTLIEQECIDELADEIGHGASVAAITERAMRGEIEFEPALRERVALLAGLPAAIVGKVLDRRITLMSGGRELVQTMRAHGAHTSLVSGGFTVFAGPIGEMLGFHDFRANTLLAGKDGAFSGKVAEPILGREAKEETLRLRLSEHGLAPDQALAVGDGANDLAMIGLAGLGVAYHAKPAVRAKADVAIEHGDLTALLYLQGYRRDEFKS
jgi:phosphoserine phosphatase